MSRRMPTIRQIVLMLTIPVRDNVNVNFLDLLLAPAKHFPPQSEEIKVFSTGSTKSQIDEWKQSLGWVQSFKIAFPYTINAFYNESESVL